jgi:hypothetical protein
MSSVMKIQVFWNVMPCWLVNNYQHFEGDLLPVSS